MEYRCYQIILPVKNVYTNQKPCEVKTGYASLGRRPDGCWYEYTRVGKMFYSRLFWIGSGSSPKYCHIFFLIVFLEETFIRNIIYIKYLIIICINDNRAIINNNCGRFKDLNPFIKIPLGIRKNFFQSLSLHHASWYKCFAIANRCTYLLVLESTKIYINL